MQRAQLSAAGRRLCAAATGTLAALASALVLLALVLPHAAAAQQGRQLGRPPAGHRVGLPHLQLPWRRSGSQADHRQQPPADQHQHQLQPRRQEPAHQQPQPHPPRPRQDERAAAAALPRQAPPAAGGRGGGGWLRRLLDAAADAAAEVAAKVGRFPEPGDPTLSPDPDMPASFQQHHYEVFPKQWEDHNKALAAVRAGNTSLGELLAPLLRSSDLVNPAQLKRSVGHLGAMHRLRRVLRDLREGRPVKLGVLGGSISWGSAVLRGEEDWFALVTARLAEAFPAAKVTGRNGCVPATPSSFMNMCLEKYLDEDVDLVFLEYATNDGWDTHNVMRRKTYERLLRKILSKPRHPAVVLVQLPTVGMAYDQRHKSKAQFHKTVEDVYGAFAAYYDLPYLSMRNAVWRLAELHHYRMNFTHYYGNNYDFIHPLERGHRVIADVVLFGLQQALADLAMSPWGRWDEEEAAAPLPRPMYPSNWQETNRLCTNGKAFESVVEAAKGWEMVNEGDDFKPKWGYVTTEVGSELVIRINTTRDTDPQTERMNVQLAYLRSYTDMGMALVKCHGGCECQDTLVNAHHELRQSTIFLLRLYPTQADRCHVSLIVQDETHSGGHKFKVTGIMVNEFRGSAGHDAEEAHEVLNSEEWLGGVNKGEGEFVQPGDEEKKAARAKQAAADDADAGGVGRGSSGGDGAKDGSSGSSGSSSGSSDAKDGGKDGGKDSAKGKGAKQEGAGEAAKDAEAKGGAEEEAKAEGDGGKKGDDGGGHGGGGKGKPDGSGGDGKKAADAPKGLAQPGGAPGSSTDSA